MGFLGLPWLIWGVLALTVAGVFAFIAPKEQGELSRAKFIIVRWFHSLVWILLGVSFFLRSPDNAFLTASADIVALSGGIVYIIYLITTFRK